MIPSVVSPDTTSPGERELFERFRDAPGTDGWIVLHSFDLPEHATQVTGEADFVVLVPGGGILCIEVKAHRRVVRNDDGAWLMGQDPPTYRSPFKQAADNSFSIAGVLDRRRREDMAHTIVWSAVFFTHTDFRQTSPEWHQWECVDADELSRTPLIEIVTSILAQAKLKLPRKVREGWPSQKQCEALASTLRPSFEVIQTPGARRREHANELQAFTERQYAALDSMRPDRNPRIIFEGPAGTGKTLLAIEAARRAAIDGEKVLLVCFNHLLGDWLKTQQEFVGENVVISTIHALMLEVAGLAPPSDPSSSFWEQALPDACLATLMDRHEPEAFDVLIADEAQDLLRGEYLDVLDLMVRGGLGDGSWMMFGDFEKQAIYKASISVGSFTEGRVAVPQFSLRENCRNTPRIAEYATLLGGLDPGYARILRPDEGPAPTTLYYEDGADQLEALAETLESLYEAGFTGSDIAILSPRSDGAAFGLSQPWSDRIRRYVVGGSGGYMGATTIHAFKGLEAPVVLLTDIENVDTDSRQALLYTGMTRATDRLVLLASGTVAQDLIELAAKSAAAR
jgi:hypothetical protein